MREHDSITKVLFPTRLGEYRMSAHKEEGQEILVLEYGELKEPVLVRMHSKCLTGDVFGSLRCDCRAQLEQSLEMIKKNGSGMLIYMDQEGRGIGLVNKVKAYKLQDEGYDTLEANQKLGFKGDERTYGAAAKIMREMGITKIKLITNNPKKMEDLHSHGIEIVERVPIVIEANGYNERYLRTKKTRMGHLL
ncbi:MAG: GTP cyclohydrolase II [Candidatus ainarchaeum sp.]|nr:GTP cyclohydrolase II [Candidatus ainarchaeum sp.]